MNTKKNPPTTTQVRAATIDAPAEDSRTVELSFSSDAIVDMSWGMERLSHANGAMVIGERQQSMPLLFNHNRDDIIGVVEEITNDGHKGRARVRFASDERGEWALALVREGVLKNASFMYQVRDYQYIEDLECYEATSWEPYEISLVTVPADASVGVGRSAPAQLAATAAPINAVKDGTITEVKMTTSIDQAVQTERGRIADLRALCAKHAISAEQLDDFINNGATLEQARAAVLDIVSSRQAQPVGQPAQAAAIDDKELQNYSLVRAINAAITGNWKAAGLERAVSEECAKRMNRTTAGFFMPTSLRASDYVVGTAAKGGNLVATQLLAGSFIELLRSKTLMLQLGATMLSGLVGNVAIPRQTSGSTVYWVNEDGAPTKSSGSFDQVTLSPRTAAALTSISRQALMQTTPDIEMLVRNDLAASLASAVDKAAIDGSGLSGEPQGIIGATGVGSVQIPVGGIDLDTLIDLETAVRAANADVGAVSYIVDANMLGKLKKLKDNTGAPIWYQQPGVAGAAPTAINGYAVHCTNQMPANKALFGAFNQLVIGEWGAVEILPNAYGSGFSSGAVEIRAMQSVDVALRHGQSFAVAA